MFRLGRRKNAKMLAYSAVFWPVARSATKSDEYCGVLKVMAMNVGFRRVLSVKAIFRQFGSAVPAQLHCYAQECKKPLKSEGPN